ncbi:EPIDERMAL PATTERNING FACTOR-like protein 4 [Fagus crenata]|uniref:Epidermal patterning factor-like protein n=1 Tax=Fagus sylvatica TaxID=28930 RepID=A0A2N9ETG8_FAGSY
MGVLRHCRHHHHHIHTLQTLTALTFLLFASAATAITLSLIGSGEVEEERALFEVEQVGLISRRRLGLGSSPPTCRSKCGRCSPCKPVHVAIHPGMTTPLEYYPEAWRCQCGNKLYMP